MTKIRETIFMWIRNVQSILDKMKEWVTCVLPTLAAEIRLDCGDHVITDP